VDVTVIVTWEDRQVTRHKLRGLPHVHADELVELLEQDLASYIDDSELPTSPEGWAVGWVAIEIEPNRP
jgi:hypothetical protein